MKITRSVLVGVLAYTSILFMIGAIYLFGTGGENPLGDGNLSSNIITSPPANITNQSADVSQMDENNLSSNITTPPPTNIQTNPRMQVIL